MIDVCTEKHKRVDERLDGHDSRLDNHSDRIKNLETTQARTEVIVQNVCKQISTLSRLAHDTSARSAARTEADG